jgi:threonine dehydratase
VQRARQQICSFVKRTPLVRNQTLSKMLGTNVYLKLEMLQRTGAFKVRGAFNKMLSMVNRDAEEFGVVAASGGNHAQAVACAAQQLGLRALVLMPEFTPRNYVDATRRYGAEVLLTPTLADAFRSIPSYEAQGWRYIHPFDDPLVIAGQGTIGLEILDDLPEVTDVIVSIGGGGLVGGVSAIKSLKPQVRIWGVETEGADSMAQALAAKRVVELPRVTSIARTLGAPAVSELTLGLAQEYLEGVTVVSDTEALLALRLMLERTKIVTEPAASCTLAAAHRLKDEFTSDHHVVLILCGGNLALDDVFQTKPAAHVELAAGGNGRNQLAISPQLF